MTPCPDMILDCHTHKVPPCPAAIVNALPGDSLLPGQPYSLGIHPWHVPEQPGALLEYLKLQGNQPQVASIGECGLDTLCGTPMWLQLKVFERQAVLAEALGKPLMVHCVRTAGEIASLRRTLRATVPWVIHGFRGKPTVLRMLLDAGCHISYGERFNAASLAQTPPERILAETDESRLPILDIIASLSASRGEDLLPSISRNTNTLFNVSSMKIITRETVDCHKPFQD